MRSAKCVKRIVLKVNMDSDNRTGWFESVIIYCVVDKLKVFDKNRVETCSGDIQIICSCWGCDLIKTCVVGLCGKIAECDNCSLKLCRAINEAGQRIGCRFHFNIENCVAFDCDFIEE